jgi:hypothetical protein
MLRRILVASATAARSLPKESSAEGAGQFAVLLPGSGTGISLVHAATLGWKWLGRRHQKSWRHGIVRRFLLDLPILRTGRRRSFAYDDDTGSSVDSDGTHTRH